MRVALLVPVTSRGTPCVGTNVRALLASVRETARPPSGDNLAILFGVDRGDPVCDPAANGALDLARMAREALPRAHVSLHLCAHPPGHICSIWRDLARRAFAKPCSADLAVLLGDDVRLVSVGWADALASAFEEVARERGVPLGFGCVAFADESFPSFPSFPVIHRVHAAWMPTIIPLSFVNQDADPFLFQIYRAFGAARIVTGARLCNTVGGAGAARYDKVRVAWNGRMLDEARDAAAQWLCWYPNQAPAERVGSHPSHPALALTLDVLVPTYRAPLAALERILALRVPEGMSTQFIVVCDRPGDADAEATMAALQAKHAHNAMVHLRTNQANIGAGPTRNRALDESAADWVLFLDDDVVPDDGILAAYARAIATHPSAFGLVGTAELPPAANARQAGVCLAGVSFFWSAARTFPLERELPWGVTANLCARRPHAVGELGAVRFGAHFPRTGGGEDIDFCLRLGSQMRSELPGAYGFVATPDARVVHPWWDGGEPSAAHFAGWAYGDGMLAQRFPEHAYVAWPNLAETLCALGLVTAAQLGVAMLATLGGGATLDARSAGAPHVSALLRACARSRMIVAAAVACVLADLGYDAWRELVARPCAECAHLPLRARARALPHGLLIRTASEAGRLRGHASRGALLTNVCRRFNWFAHMWHGARAVERADSLHRTVARATLCAAVLAVHAVHVREGVRDPSDG